MKCLNCNWEGEELVNGRCPDCGSYNILNFVNFTLSQAADFENDIVTIEDTPPGQTVVLGVNSKDFTPIADGRAFINKIYEEQGEDIEPDDIITIDLTAPRKGSSVLESLKREAFIKL